MEQSRQTRITRQSQSHSSSESLQDRPSQSSDGLLVADSSSLPTQSMKVSSDLPLSSMKFSQSRKWVSGIRKEIKFITQKDCQEQNEETITHAKALVYLSPESKDGNGRISSPKECRISASGTEKNWERAVRWAHQQADKKIQRARRGRSNSLKTRFLRTEQRIEQVVGPQRFRRMHLQPSHSQVVRQKILGKMQDDPMQALSRIPQQTDEFITNSVIGDSQIIQVVIGMAQTDSVLVISEQGEPCTPPGNILRTFSRD